MFIDLFIFSLFDILNQASKNEGKTDLDSERESKSTQD